MSTRNPVAGYYVIPAKAFNEEYFINKECDIIKNDKRSGILERTYHWDPKTAKKALIFRVNGTNFRFTPLQMYLLTFYGYCKSEISLHDEKTGGLLPTDYSYELKDIVQDPSDENKLYIDGMEFRKSTFMDDIYVTDSGCIYDLSIDKIGRYTLKDKIYNYRMYNNEQLAQIVYDAWVGTYDKNKEIHHKDDNEWNNHYSNLAQLTRAEHLRIHGMNSYSKELIREICQVMQDEQLQAWQAAARFNVRRDFVYRLISGESHTNITKDYHFAPIQRFVSSKLTEKDVGEICELFVQRELTNKQIAEIYGVNQYTIQDIRKKSSWSSVSDNYDYVKESDLGSKDKPSAPYSPRNRSITEDQVKQVWGCLQKGIKMTKIPELTGVNYGIVKKIKYRTRWTQVTDNLGPIPGDSDYDPNDFL